jgi:hypothetical protein
MIVTFSYITKLKKKKEKKKKEILLACKRELKEPVGTLVKRF